MNDTDQFIDTVAENGLDSKRSVLIAQQILSHESGALSLEGLSYRNPDMSETTLKQYLDCLSSLGIVEETVVDTGGDIPDTYWVVTDQCVEEFEEMNILSGVEVLVVVDSVALKKTDRIEQIESFDGRPETDVNEMLM